MVKGTITENNNMKHPHKCWMWPFAFHLFIIIIAIISNHVT